jgi:hypothetical protein
VSLSDFLNIDNDQCRYEGLLGKAHEMYQKTGDGWSFNEYEALRINNKLNLIKDNSPVNRNDDFKKSIYYVFQKPFAMWARACQSEYPTTEVVSVGQTLADSSEAKRFVFIFSIVVFCLPFGFYILSLLFCRCSQNFDRSGNCYILVCTLIEIVFQIVLIIYQSQTIAILNAINLELISFAADN